MGPTDQQVKRVSVILPGMLVNLVGGVSTAAGAFAVTVAAGRALGVRDSATFFEAIAIFSILTVIGQVGSSRGLVWSVAGALADERADEVRPIVRTSVIGVAGASFVLAVGLFVTAPFFASHLSNGEAGGLSESLRALAFVLPAACLGSILLAGTRGFSAMVPTVMMDGVFKSVLRVLAVSMAVIFAPRTTVLVAAWSLPVVLVLIGSAVWLRTLIGRLESVRPANQTPAIARSFWRFSSLQVMSDFFQVGVQWLDILLLGALGTAADTGTYAAIGRVVFVGLLGLVAVAQVIAPHMSALLTTGDRENAQSIYQGATLWLCVVSFPLYLTLAAYSGLVTTIFGPGFHRGSVPLAILSLAMLANVGTGPIMAVLVMGGKSGLGMVDTAVALTVNIVLNLLLIPPFGMIGATVAWSVSIAIVNGLPALQVWRLWRISPFGRDYWAVAAASLLTFGGISIGIRYAGGQTFTSLALSVSVATPVYLALLSRTRLYSEIGTLWSHRSSTQWQ